MERQKTIKMELGERQQMEEKRANRYKAKIIKYNPLCWVKKRQYSPFISLAINIWVFSTLAGRVVWTAKERREKREKKKGGRREECRGGRLFQVRGCQPVHVSISRQARRQCLALLLWVSWWGREQRVLRAGWWMGGKVEGWRGGDNTGLATQSLLGLRLEGASLADSERCLGTVEMTKLSYTHTYSHTHTQSLSIPIPAR